MKKSVGYAVTVTVIAAGMLAAGCGSANEEPTTPAAESSKSAESDTLVRKLEASASTRAETGIVSWTIHRRGTVFTTRGLDTTGAVKSELGVALDRANDRLAIHAGGAGTLVLRTDGTVVSNDFEPSKVPALSHMTADLHVERKDTPYGACLPDLWFDDLMYGFGSCPPWSFGCVPRSGCNPEPVPCAIYCYTGRVDPISCQCLPFDEPTPWWGASSDR